MKSNISMSDSVCYTIGCIITCGALCLLRIAISQGIRMATKEE